MDYWTTVAWAMVALIAVFVLLMFKIDLGATVQFWLFAFTVAVGFGYLILFIFTPQFDTANWSPFFYFGVPGFLTGVGLMITMYFGFELIPQFAEECKYPHKKHWKVMIAGIFAAMVLYVSICLVETAMAPLDTILAFPNFVAVFFARETYGEWLAILIAAANIATLLSCVLGFWLGGARVMYSMDRDKIFPKLFLKLNRWKQPINANILIFIITIFFILQSGQGWMAALFTMMAIGIAIAYTATCASFVQLRRKHPDWIRPWKTPGGMATGSIAVIAGVFICYEVFIFFNLDMWILFIVYFAIGAVVRAFLWWDSKRDPGHYARGEKTQDS